MNREMSSQSNAESTSSNPSSNNFTSTSTNAGYCINWTRRHFMMRQDNMDRNRICTLCLSIAPVSATSTTISKSIPSASSTTLNETHIQVTANHLILNYSEAELSTTILRYRQLDLTQCLVNGLSTSKDLLMAGIKPYGAFFYSYFHAYWTGENQKIISKFVDKVISGQPIAMMRDMCNKWHKLYSDAKGNNNDTPGRRKS